MGRAAPPREQGQSVQQQGLVTPPGELPARSLAGCDPPSGSPARLFSGAAPAEMVSVALLGALSPNTDAR